MDRGVGVYFQHCLRSCLRRILRKFFNLGVRLLSLLFEHVELIPDEAHHNHDALDSHHNCSHSHDRVDLVERVNRSICLVHSRLVVHSRILVAALVENCQRKDSLFLSFELIFGRLDLIVKCT